MADADRDRDSKKRHERSRERSRSRDGWEPSERKRCVDCINTFAMPLSHEVQDSPFVWSHNTQISVVEMEKGKARKLHLQIPIFPSQHLAAVVSPLYAKAWIL